MANLETSDVLNLVRDKIADLASQTAGGRAVTLIGDDDPLMGSSLFDSTATIDLVLWLEETFPNNGAEIELTAEKYGSINKIVQSIMNGETPLIKLRKFGNASIPT